MSSGNANGPTDHVIIGTYLSFPLDHQLIFPDDDLSGINDSNLTEVSFDDSRYTVPASQINGQYLSSSRSDNQEYDRSHKDF
jgi:hypothetical protein